MLTKRLRQIQPITWKMKAVYYWHAEPYQSINFTLHEYNVEALGISEDGRPVGVILCDGNWHVPEGDANFLGYRYPQEEKDVYRSTMVELAERRIGKPFRKVPQAEPQGLTTSTESATLA